MQQLHFYFLAPVKPVANEGCVLDDAQTTVVLDVPTATSSIFRNLIKQISSLYNSVQLNKLVNVPDLATV
jgi:hypothetical protein